MFKKIAYYDKSLSQAFSDKFIAIPSPLFWKICSKSGSQSAYPLLIIIVYLGFSFTFLEIILLTFYLILLTLLLMVLKPVIGRERPRDDLKIKHYFDNFSMPSGHSARFGLISAVLLLSNSHTLLYMIFLVWVLFILLSRVILKHHYILDIVFGYLIGFTIGIILTEISAITKFS